MKKITSVFFSLFFFFLLLLSFSPGAFSAPLSREAVPEPLKPWVDWVLKGQEKNLCPFLNGEENQRECLWSSTLVLNLEEKGGQFTATAWVNDAGWLALPGGEDRWPQGVKVDGQGGSVIFRENAPQVYLKPGFHTVTGSFQWDNLPESLVIPPRTGLVRLTLLGKPIEFPKHDSEGRLWLEKSTKEGTGEERLEIRVHRLLADEIPATLTTRIVLDVSGKNREITLGKAVPEGFIPMSMTSPLPVRIEKDGSLKIQAQAGQWTVEIKYRHEGPLSAVTLPPAQAGWAAEEVWVFEAKNNLRLVSVEGVPSIDPQQTTLPDEWKKFPAYRLLPGETLSLAEKRRGDSDPAPDQLTLHREFWLDFDGKGYTIQDQVSGVLNRSLRLEMNPPVKLGRVSVEGKDQLITHLPGKAEEGVELSNGSLQLTSESRLSKGGPSFSAVGWNHVFQQVSGVLHLPPGWRIFSAWGVDQAPETWVHRWTLLDFFVVLIVSLSFAKLWGKRFGLIALVTLTLTFTENNAPQWIWLAVLAGYALLRLVTKGWMMKFLKLYRLAVVVVLILISLPFMVNQVRFGLYPALERPYQVLEATSARGVSTPQPSTGMMMLGGGYAAKPPMKAMEEAPAPPPAQNAEAPRLEKQRNLKVDEEKVQDSDRRTEKKKEAAGYGQQDLNLVQHQPGAKVQTGPGLPHWEWEVVNLSWTGPVDSKQTLHLCLISPAVNLFLAFFRVLSLALLILCLFQFPGSFWPRWMKRSLASTEGEGEVLPMKKGVASAGLLLVFLFPLLFFSRVSHADFPSKELLEELRTRLLENPECYPDCASISRMQVEVSGTLFRARLEASSQVASAIPLPGSAAEWMPSTVVLDGKNEVGLFRSEEGHLWMQIPPGVHQILVEGPLPERETVQIALPLKPYFVEVKAQGYSVGGVHEDGQVDDNLQLTRQQAVKSTETKSFQSDNLPPFVRVVRQLNLGLTWEVETRIERLTPVGNAVVLEIPLLEGESVTTAGVRVQNGKVQVSMAPNVEDFSWNSVMNPRESISLKAPQNLEWTELWRLNAASLWHVTAEGIPPVHPESPDQAEIREWQPWPGEELKLGVVRPEAVEGPTMTIDQSLIVINPGLRTSEMTLSFQLRSSLGGQHTILLPEGAELQTVSINGAQQPIRQDKNQVTLPIVPGSQSFELKWNQPPGIRAFFKTPPVNLKLPSVNSEIQMNVGVDRWILFTCGPRMGPAVLFWSLFIVLILVAVALSRVPLTPLSTLQWVLLGLGLSQAPVWAAAIVAGWLLVLGWRKKRPLTGNFGFDCFQLFLLLWTLAALIVLFGAIHQGLLGIPEMEIAGNGSSYTFLRWFQDRSGEVLPQPWVFSLRMFFYRLAMLAWALWIAWALLKWLRWGWDCFSEGGRWRAVRVVKKTPQT